MENENANTENENAERLEEKPETSPGSNVDDNQLCEKRYSKLLKEYFEKEWSNPLYDAPPNALLTKDTDIGEKLGIRPSTVKSYRHRHFIPDYATRLRNALDETREMCLVADRTIECMGYDLNACHSQIESYKRSYRVTLCVLGIVTVFAVAALFI